MSVKQNNLKTWFKSGTPWIWMNAGAVSIAVIMTLGLLMVIAVRGLGHFWPADIVEADYQIPGQQAKVMAGEKQYIFPYQEHADEMFNSTLIYELAVLKKHALPLLTEIKPESPAYDEARRLIALLNFVLDLPDDLVPANSILREFIGGSFFD